MKTGAQTFKNKEDQNLSFLTRNEVSITNILAEGMVYAKKPKNACKRQFCNIVSLNLSFYLSTLPSTTKMKGLKQNFGFERMLVSWNFLHFQIWSKHFVEKVNWMIENLFLLKRMNEPNLAKHAIRTRTKIFKVKDVFLCCPKCLDNYMYVCM